MLVLTRHPGEAIRIGPDVVITVLASHGKKISIGVEAPQSVLVMREELGAMQRDVEEELIPEEELPRW